MKISENRHAPDGEAMPKIKAAWGVTQAISANNICQFYRKLKRFIKRIHSLYSEIFNHIPYTFHDSLWFVASMLICLILMYFLR